MNFVKNQNSDSTLLGSYLFVWNILVYHKTFQNIRFSDGIKTKNDPLNIPIFGFEVIFLKEVRSSQ